MSGEDFGDDLIGLVDYHGRRIVAAPTGGFWNVLKTFLNTELIGVELKRREIIQELELPRGRHTTLDCYLNYLHKAGYLHKPKRGWYGLRITIPSLLSVDDCRSEAYGIIDADGHRRVLHNHHTRLKESKKEFFDKEEFDI